MARQEMTVQVITDVGLVNPTFDVAHVDGHQFVNSGEEFVLVKNANAGTVVLTIKTPQTVQGLAVTERTITMLTMEDAYIGRFTKSLYDQASPDAGKVHLDFDIQANVTLEVFRVA